MRATCIAFATIASCLAACGHSSSGTTPGVEDGAMPSTDANIAEVGPRVETDSSSEPSDAASALDASSAHDGMPPPPPIEEVYRVTDASLPVARLVGALFARGDRLFWTERGSSKSGTWGVWTCELPACKSAQRLTDPAAWSLAADDEYLYVAEEPALGLAARIYRCRLDDPSSCAAPEVLNPAWGASGVFTAIHATGGAVFLTSQDGGISRCSSRSNCNTTTTILPFGSDISGYVVADAERVFFGGNYESSKGVHDELLAACPATGCSSGPDAMWLAPAPTAVGGLALDGKTLFLADHRHAKDSLTQASRVVSCDVTGGIPSCGASSKVVMTFEARTPPNPRPQVEPIAVDDTYVYAAALDGPKDTLHIVRCPRTGCSGASPEVVAVQKDFDSTVHMALTSTHVYWSARDEKSAGVFRVPKPK